MKMWSIFHYTYGDDAEGYGKECKTKIIGFIMETENNIKSLVDKLNERNHSYYRKDKPEDEYDFNFMDEDYISYEELKFNTLEEIENLKYI